MRYTKVYGNAVALVSACIMFITFVATAQNTLTLNVGQATHNINRALYGALMEDLGRDIYNGLYVGTGSSIPNTRGMRNDIINAFKEAGITCLEWPGGCAVWNYDWKEGIGPQRSRPGGEMTNGLGTSEYFLLNQLINGEPYITCNMRTATPQDMAAWLNYIADTVAWKNALKYWKIGNEEWGGCGAGLTVAEFNTKYQQYVAAIPVSYNGKLVRIAEGGQGTAWVTSVMNTLMGKMEAVSLHYYAVTNWSAKGPSMNFTEAQYYAQLRVAYAMEGKVRDYEAAMNVRDPNHTVGLFVDEWGAWYDAIPGMGTFYQQNTVRDALIAVMNLNIFNNHCRRVTMALSAQPVNVIHSLMLTQNPSTTAMIKTPTFYVYKMLKPHQNATMIPATLNSGTVEQIPVISASASIDSARTIHISLGNMHATANQTVAVTLNNMSGSYTASGEIINGPATTSYNDYNVAEQVTIKTLPTSNYTLSGTSLSVTLPAHSIVMMTLRPASASTVNRRSRTGCGYSLAFQPNGDLALTLDRLAKMPLGMKVFSSNGRLVNGVTCQSAGSKRIVWRPHGAGLVAGSYLAVLSVDGITIVRQVAVSQN
ncbi:MAG: hypothetical protein JXA71_09795 [Chitinispirillaceae bacterium]|nr:hypothetical protein [Chitinispirillaceae bacterium]